MNKNRIALVFAGIFLAIVLAAPTIFFIEETSTYQLEINNFPNDADETQNIKLFKQYDAETHYKLDHFTNN